MEIYEADGGFRMGKIDETEYWVPEHVREYLHNLGFYLPLEAMEGHIRVWHEWMSAVGDFYDYKDYVSSHNMLRTGMFPLPGWISVPAFAT